ncbi:MAG TPA: GNAT family N-acetyltransferase [Puia sp.]|nr:GNAT family N-acetyltransferase [Puia sp.]
MPKDGPQAYKDTIPADRYHEPYMPEKELQDQISDGVEFWKYTEDNHTLGVIGIQYKGEVTLIRHAYVRTSERSKGIGSKLLEHLCSMTATPILIGTWTDAGWAIKFYQKHGFHILGTEEKTALLRKYWRQVRKVYKLIYQAEIFRFGKSVKNVDHYLRYGG